MLRIEIIQSLMCRGVRVKVRVCKNHKLLNPLKKLGVSVVEQRFFKPLLYQK
jgi:hypothetical protein